jgi:hypothetical protein
MSTFMQSCTCESNSLHESSTDALQSNVSQWRGCQDTICMFDVMRALFRDLLKEKVLHAHTFLVSKLGDRG